MMTDTTQTGAAAPATVPHSQLEHFPVTFFAIVMGMTGLSLALSALERAYGMAPVGSVLAYAASILIFGLVSVFYVLKAMRYPAAVRAEWNHPVRLAFFPAISISLLLIATLTLARAPALAEAMWLVGVVVQGALTIAVISGWIGHRAFQTPHLSPAWFIPAVGNVIVPIAGVQMGYLEVSWYFLSVGLIFWIVLLTLVMNRLIFHDPMPGRLQPTLVILIAPPAVGFLAWVSLTGQIDAFARILMNGAYLFTLLVAVQLPRIVKLPFALSFWALSFPFAAVTVASFLYADRTGSAAHHLFGTVLAGVLLVIIAALLLRTLRAIRADEICRPE